MKIKRVKNLVEFTPETEEETQDLQHLWNTIVSCHQFNQKLVPVGEFIPQKNNVARFSVEENKPVQQTA